MMIADTRAVLERAIEEGLFRYLLNRVNKHHTRIKWVTGLVFDREPLGEPQDLKFDEYEAHIRRIVDEIMHFPEVTQGVTMCTQPVNDSAVMSREIVNTVAGVSREADKSPRVARDRDTEKFALKALNDAGEYGMEKSLRAYFDQLAGEDTP